MRRFGKKIEAYKLQEGSELLHSLQGLPFRMLYQDGSARELPEFKIVRPAPQGFDRNMFLVEYTTLQGTPKSFSHKRYYDDGSPFMLAFDLNDDSDLTTDTRSARGLRKSKRRRRVKQSRRKFKRSKRSRR